MYACVYYQICCEIKLCVFEQRSPWHCALHGIVRRRKVQGVMIIHRAKEYLTRWCHHDSRLTVVLARKET